MSADRATADRGREDKSSTSIELPAVDVNDVLNRRYTGTFDEALAALFTTVGKDPFLGSFNEVYLREVLHRDLQRKPA